MHYLNESVMSVMENQKVCTIVDFSNLSKNLQSVIKICQWKCNNDNG